MARTTREVWKRRVEAWGRSGLTAKQYAAQIGANPNTLAHWKWQLGAQARAARSGPRPAFVEVVAAPRLAPAEPAPGHEGIELVLPSGLRIRLPPDFDATALRRILDAVEGR